MGTKQNNEIDEADRAPRNRQRTSPDALTIVLVHPRIPQNAGSVARLCAATGSRLDLVQPLFRIDDKKLKRAGLDYWPLLDVRVFDNLDQWFAANPAAVAEQQRCWFVEVGGATIYTDATFQPGDVLFFGDEEAGLSSGLLAAHPNRTLRLPQQGVRSLNLATAVSIVCYEALRQLHWLTLES